jgi:hypothetical protein
MFSKKLIIFQSRFFWCQKAVGNNCQLELPISGDDKKIVKKCQKRKDERLFVFFPPLTFVFGLISTFCYPLMKTFPSSSKDNLFL